MDEIKREALIMVGIIVAAISLIINVASQSWKLSLFLVAGIVLIIWGALKSPEKERPQRPAPQQPANNQYYAQSQYRNQQNRPPGY